MLMDVEKGIYKQYIEFNFDRTRCTEALKQALTSE